MISYYQLGENKKLNEIVFAGSHDAAITQGGGNAKTQDLDVHGQASAGVLLFDIRFTGPVLKKGGAEKVLRRATGSGWSQVARNGQLLIERWCQQMHLTPFSGAASEEGVPDPLMFAGAAAEAGNRRAYGCAGLRVRGWSGDTELNRSDG